MKTLIFGKGMLGRRIADYLPGSVLSSEDITDPIAITWEIMRHQPDAVINAAGKTGRPNVDWCEEHREETYRSNVVGPLALAEVCAHKNLYLLHMGSGCIFYGRSPDPVGWREEDYANPVSFYARTKYSADLILSKLPNISIVRIRMPIDSLPGSRNLIDKLVQYKKIVSADNSVTVVEDLLKVIEGVVSQRATGIFHATNPGVMRHENLLGLYKQYVDPSHTCEFTTPEDLLREGLITKERSNCILSSRRLEELGLGMRHISVALPDVVKKYAAVVIGT
ncbi:MAG: NAD-dependent epimerase/dehydratase family protein [Caulobacteraceae bacterium]|nr:NAD-dependent epimerase/dehydratase family protein [Caulobacteraceae bacterium]